MSKRSIRRSRRRGRPSPFLWMGGVVFLFLAGWFMFQGGGATPAYAAYPPGVEENPRALAAYQAADHLRKTNPEAMDYIPCYCGCGRMGHKSIRSCFLTDRGYGDHGAYCDVCQNIMLTLDRGLKEGRTVREIREAVDAYYSRDPRFVPTPTPMPPEDL